MMLGLQKIKKSMLAVTAILFLASSNMQAMSWFFGTGDDTPAVAPGGNPLQAFQGVIDASGLMIREKTWEEVKKGCLFGGCVAGGTALFLSVDTEKTIKAVFAGAVVGGVFGWQRASSETRGVALTRRLAEAGGQAAAAQRENHRDVAARLLAVEQGQGRLERGQRGLRGDIAASGQAMAGQIALTQFDLEAQLAELRRGVDAVPGRTVALIERLLNREAAPLDQSATWLAIEPGDNVTQ